MSAREGHPCKSPADGAGMSNGALVSKQVVSSLLTGALFCMQHDGWFCVATAMSNRIKLLFMTQGSHQSIPSRQEKRVN